MDDNSAARPYAEAAFRFAGADSMAWEDKLTALAEIVKTDEVKALIADPRYDISQREQALLALVEKMTGSVDEKFGNFVHQLLDNDRITVSQEIARQYSELARKAAGILNIEIRTAFPLSKEQIEKIAAGMKKRSNSKEVRTVVIEDETIAGGIRITAGDDVIDGTISAAVNQLRSSLMQG